MSQTRFVVIGRLLFSFFFLLSVKGQRERKGHAQRKLDLFLSLEKRNEKSTKYKGEKNWKGKSSVYSIGRRGGRHDGKMK